MKKLVALLGLGMLLTVAISTAQGHQGFASQGGELPGQFTDCWQCHCNPDFCPGAPDLGECPPRP